MDKYGLLGLKTINTYIKTIYLSAHIFLIRKYIKWLTFYENKKDKYTLNSGKEIEHSNPEQNLPTQEVIDELGRDVQRL